LPSIVTFIDLGVLECLNNHNYIDLNDYHINQHSDEKQSCWY